MTVLILF